MFPITFSVILVICNLGPMVTLARPNIVEMPDECRGKNYCFKEHVKYPHDIIEKLLNESEPDLWFEDDSDVFEPRAGTKNNDCKVRTESGPIYEIIDEKGELRYVVQSKKKYQQIMKVEECSKPGRLTERTLHFTDYDVKKNKLHCEQKNIHFNFLVLTPDFTGVELAKAKGGIPVCCSCVYHKN